MTVDKQNLKESRQERIVRILSYIVLVFAIPFTFVFIGIPIISSIQAAKLAKDPKNIRNNGCLRYATVTDKYGASMFYLNQQGPHTLRELSIKSNLSSQIGKLIDESNLSYNEFVKIHTKKCIQVRYIHYKLLGTSGDYIYDLQ